MSTKNGRASGEKIRFNSAKPGSLQNTFPRTTGSRAQSPKGMAQTMKAKPQSGVNPLRMSSSHSNTLMNSTKNALTRLEMALEGNQDIKKDSPKASGRTETTKSAFVSASGEFKTKPLRRYDNDFLLYKEIFVNPKQQALNGLHSKGEDFINMFYEGSKKQYDQILDIKKEKHTGLRSYYDSQGRPTDAKPQDNHGNEHEGDRMEATANPGQTQTMKKTKQIEEMTFFDQQIQVQPPEMPNSTLASPLTPGNGWAPSIPPTHPNMIQKPNLKDLLVRAKAGMQAGDIQKEAHLSFYLGMVQENSSNFVEAIRYYKKFFGCAKAMEDKIGMALAMNRIGTNYYKLKKFDKSVECHLRHLELTNVENAFASYYNLGIALRNHRKYEASLDYFQKALDWARQNGEFQSECLSLGQIGITFYRMDATEDAKPYLDECYAMSGRLRNNKLQLDCLMYLSKLNPETAEEQLQQGNADEFASGRYQDAYKCARAIGDNKKAAVCLVNLGILEGVSKFQSFIRTSNS